MATSMLNRDIVALLIPSDRGLVSALEELGRHEIRVVTTNELFAAVPAGVDVIILNALGLHQCSDRESQIRHLLSEMYSMGLSDIPVVVIEPESREWGGLGWGSSSWIAARLRAPVGGAAIREAIDRAVEPIQEDGPGE